jgi:antitoxin PrlF
MTHTIGAKGQVVIPKALRDALGIHPGQEVVFERRDAGVIVRKAGTRPLNGRFAGNNLADALLAARRDDMAMERRG